MALCSVGVSAHDPNAPPITWNREISRLIYERCASCHRAGGTAFSMMTYQEVQPRAVEIKDAVTARRMPPWGAVKGFGDFRNDQGLTQQQISLFVDWVEGGTARGNNPNALPAPPKFDKPTTGELRAGSIAVSGAATLQQAVTIDGLLPENIGPDTSAQIVAVLPDGQIEPLVWLYKYQASSPHPFLFRKPLRLPAFTKIQGVPHDARIILLPVAEAKR
jgi:hypothetical protein